MTRIPSAPPSGREPMSTEQPSLPLDESAEERALRATVRAVAGRYGHEYFLATARAGQSPTRLWSELGTAGLLGVAIPEQYGGGGGTLRDLSWSPRSWPLPVSR